jgi:hypothetical protein
MFSNGIEYESFLCRQCDGCPYYFDWEKNPKKVCPVEDLLAQATFDRSLFPDEWLDQEGAGPYTCRRKKGLGAKE